MSRDIRFLPDDSNPYAAPSAPARPSTDRPGAVGLELFLRWEKLRVLYNAILGVETLVLLGTIRPSVKGGTPALLEWLAVLCFAANVCYCVGPVLDGYAHLIGLRGRSVTGVLFGLGTSFSILLALAAIVSMSGFMID